MAPNIIPVNVKDLPSGGLQSKGQQFFELHPATFKQMMKYDGYPSVTYIQRLRRDILLLKDDIPDLSKVSMFDMDGLIFLKKSISISKDPEFSFTIKCPHCGATNPYKVKLSEISYQNVDKTVFDINYVEIAGVRYAINIPTVDYVKQAVETFHAYKEDVPPKIFILCCLLGFNENPRIKAILENTVLDDIVLIEYLYKLLSGASKIAEYTCQSCHQKGTVEVNQVSTDMFLDLRLNCRIPQEKIIFDERVRNRRAESGSDV